MLDTELSPSLFTHYDMVHVIKGNTPMLDTELSPSLFTHYDKQHISHISIDSCCVEANAFYSETESSYFILNNFNFRYKVLKHAKHLMVKRLHNKDRGFQCLSFSCSGNYSLGLNSFGSRRSCITNSSGEQRSV